MSDNFFDENIRKKLETIRPEYSEAAWKRLRSSLPVPWYVSFLRDFGGWIFGGIASVAFLTTFYNNQLTKKENEVLNEKISTIKNQSLNNVTGTDTVFITKQDTVYLTKYQTRTKVRYVYLNENHNQSSGDISDDRISANLSKKQAKETLNKSSDNQNKDKNFVNAQKQIKDQPQAQGASEKISGDNPVVTAENPSGNLGQEKQKTMVAAAEENTVKEVPKPANDNAIPFLDELAVAETRKPVEEKKGSKLTDFMKNLNPRFGVTGDYMGLKANSMGPIIEFLLGGRFSISTGLLITGKNDLKFGLPRDFNMGTGKKFEDRYKEFFGEKPLKIEDIKIETQSVKMPLYFNYYVPFKYNLDFVLTTGTKLNLSTVENVSYMGSNNFGNNYIERFENQYKSRVFNNLLYGMGIQYHKSRFAGQVIPYFEFPFSQGNALSPPKKFGINASLRFSLKK